MAEFAYPRKLVDGGPSGMREKNFLYVAKLRSDAAAAVSRMSGTLTSPSRTVQVLNDTRVERILLISVYPEVD